MLDNVCRLCLGTENLLWIFDEKVADNMPEIIEVTSGVQITKSDTITQMVCSTCCQITIKMFKFRTTSVKNDKDLKAKCAGYNVSQLTNVNLETKKEITSHKNRYPQKYKFAHPSIKDIIKKYPDIKLPEISLKSHFGPYITLLTDEVDDWYKDRNFSEDDIQSMKKKASEYAENAQENGSNVRRRRKRRKVSFDSKVWSTTRRSSSEGSAYNQSLNKRTKFDDEGAVKSTKSVNNVVTKSNTNVDVKPKENISQTDVDAKIQSMSKSDKNENNTKATSNIVKTNVNYKNSSVTSTDSVIKLKTTSSVEPKSQLTMGSVLQSMINRENIPRKPDTEITLKSLLAEANASEKARSSETTAVANDNTKDQTVINELVRKSHNKVRKPSLQSESSSDVIEIDDTVLTENVNDKTQQTCMFTTTPFVRNAQKFRGKKSVNEAHVDDSLVTALLILSDSDEDTHNQRKNKNSSVNSIDDAPTQNVEVRKAAQSGSLTKPNQSVDDKLHRGNKSDFIRSLELAPKAMANMPDLSLLSVTEKTNTLYICKVCDSHYNSLKELKIHTRRIHTKCPFCSKRFRNLANRDEHIKYNCVANISRFELKKPKLALVRVDEVEEIRTKYPNAFKSPEDEKNVTEQEVVQNISRETSTPSSSRSELLPTVSLISTPYTAPLSTIPTSVSSSTITQSQASHTSSTVSPSVAPESQQSRTPPEQPSSSVQPSSSEHQTSNEKQTNKPNARSKYDAETADAVRELEKFLESSPVKSSTQKKTADVTNHTDEPNASGSDVVSDNTDIICISDDEGETFSNSYVGGSNRKVKIINNEMLRNINLHDNDTNILKRILSEAIQRKGVELNGMKDNTIIDGGTSKVKVFKHLRRHLQHYKIPVDISYNPVLNVEYRIAKTPSQKRVKDTWTDMIPQDLRSVTPVQAVVTSTLSARKNVPNILPNVKASCRGTSVIVPTHSSNASGNLVTNIFQPNLGGVEQQRNVSHLTQFQNNVETVPSSHNLILTSHNPLVSTSQVSHSFAPSTPVILNNTSSIYTTHTTPTSSYIIVPTSLVATSENATITTLPATQGPLPVIQSVATAHELEPSFNNSTQSASLLNSSTIQPSIRVRNLSELS